MREMTVNETSVISGGEIAWLADAAGIACGVALAPLELSALAGGVIATAFAEGVANAPYDMPGYSHTMPRQ